MTRVHIRTDDEVYRVDAVWLGPPRATFPWRARYSAYGVGLVVMLVVMFVQRRLGIDLGFFSVAWALLITVAITRFVSRRINDERPLLEWLTLFVHELRGPRAHHRVIGGALTTGHVTVRRDRPKLTGAPTAIALPRGSGSAAAGGPARPAAVDPADDAAWGPPPRDDEPRVAPVVAEPAAQAPSEPAAEPAAEPVAEPVAEPADGSAAAPAAEARPADTPGVPTGGPSHARASRRVPSEATLARRRARAERARAATAAAQSGPSAGADKPAELPPVPDPRAGDATMAAWTGRDGRREAVPARRTGSAVRKAAAEPDPDRTQRRPARPRRRPGWPMSNEPASPSGRGTTGTSGTSGTTGTTGTAAPFGPGSRSRDADRGDHRGDPGAAPR